MQRSIATQHILDDLPRSAERGKLKKIVYSRSTVHVTVINNKQQNLSIE